MTPNRWENKVPHRDYRNWIRQNTINQTVASQSTPLEQATELRLSTAASSPNKPFTISRSRSPWRKTVAHVRTRERVRSHQVVLKSCIVVVSVGLREVRVLSQPAQQPEKMSLCWNWVTILVKMCSYFFLNWNFLHREKGRKKTYSYHNALQRSGRKSSADYAKFVFFVISLKQPGALGKPPTFFLLHCRERNESKLVSN